LELFCRRTQDLRDHLPGASQQSFPTKFLFFRNRNKRTRRTKTKNTDTRPHLWCSSVSLWYRHTLVSSSISLLPSVIGTHLIFSL
jgi:hypothetical protein